MPYPRVVVNPAQADAMDGRFHRLPICEVAVCRQGLRSLQDHWFGMHDVSAGCENGTRGLLHYSDWGKSWRKTDSSFLDLRTQSSPRSSVPMGTVRMMRHRRMSRSEL